MGLFGGRNPKLPSYSGVDLGALLQDPQWAYAIQQAGINPRNCEIVLRLADVTVGRGLAYGPPEQASPAIFFGQGATLSMAYPTEREVVVVKKDKLRAELQTERSGWFQIVFGSANNLDGFMFWGHRDNLRLGTPEGENFGKFMSAFMRGQLRPGQVVGTPQSLVASGGGVSVEPEFSDPEDALRWKLTFAVQGALVAMMDRYQECFEQAENIEKAYGMSTVGHPISQENFRKLAMRLEGEIPAALARLREATRVAASLWRDLMFLFPSYDTANQLGSFGQWCAATGIPQETYSAIIGKGMFIYTDFGLTRDSFWTENERVTSVMNRPGQ